MSYLVESILTTKYGLFSVKAYNSGIDQFPHMALYTKNFNDNGIVNLRIHSECMTGDVFGSTKCDCGEQLDYSLKYIKDNEGILLYLRQEGRGIGLVNKLMAYNLQNEGFNTKEANLEMGFHSDLRNYEIAISILEDMQVKKIRLLTNNPEKIKAFNNSKIELISRVPVEIKPKPENIKYLQTKKQEMGHLLTLNK